MLGSWIEASHTVMMNTKGPKVEGGSARRSPKESDRGQREVVVVKLIDV